LETFLFAAWAAEQAVKLGVDPAQIADMARVVTHAPDGSDRPVGGLKKIYEADAKTIYEKAI
jgi:hypothetical protein